MTLLFFKRNIFTHHILVKTDYVINITILKIFLEISEISKNTIIAEY
jgi:hypothetical protein